jgi:hypothetical protein
MRCLNIIHKKRGSVMIDPDEHEAKALEGAGQMGGEYLESLGVTDLGQMTAEQWALLVECIVTGYQDALATALGDSE